MKGTVRKLTANTLALQNFWLLLHCTGFHWNHGYGYEMSLHILIRYAWAIGDSAHSSLNLFFFSPSWNELFLPFFFLNQTPNRLLAEAMVNIASYSSKHLEVINLFTYKSWEGKKNPLFTETFPLRKNSGIFYITCLTSMSHLIHRNKHNNILQSQPSSTKSTFNSAAYKMYV